MGYIANQAIGADNSKVPLTKKNTVPLIMFGMAMVPTMIGFAMYHRQNPMQTSTVCGTAKAFMKKRPL